MAAKDFIVAIELGSSKVTGIAGQKNLDGSTRHRLHRFMLALVDSLSAA